MSFVYGLKGYRICAILLPGIWDTVFIIWVTLRDIEYLGNLIMWITVSLKEILDCLLQKIWDIWYPLYIAFLWLFNQYFKPRVHGFAVLCLGG